MNQRSALGDLRGKSPMNEVDELVAAMATIVFAALMLVAGGLYMERSPTRDSTVPAAQMASAP